MSTDCFQNISYKYCPRFGQLALEMGFITEDQLMEAFRCQLDDKHSGQAHRLLGRVLLDKEWMTSNQIEQVMNMLMKRMRLEDADYSLIVSDLISMTPPGECNG